MPAAPASEDRLSRLSCVAWHGAGVGRIATLAEAREMLGRVGLAARVAHGPGQPVRHDRERRDGDEGHHDQPGRDGEVGGHDEQAYLLARPRMIRRTRSHRCLTAASAPSSVGR